MPGRSKASSLRPNNPRFAYDAYRRFIQLFGKIAMNVPDEHFDRAMSRPQDPRRRGAGRRSFRRAARGTRAALPRHLSRAHRSAVSRRSVRAARAFDRGRVPVVDGQACRRLPPPVPDHEGDGERHRGQRLHDGVRQHGQRLRDGRRLHAQPGHRRERHLRRVPRERAGRGRGRRHPHAEAARGDGAGNAGPASAARGAARQARRPTTAKCRTSSSRSSEAASTACRRATAR